jgi:chromosome segregation ATPase
MNGLDLNLKVKKKELVETLRKQRADHMRQYNEAMRKWRELMQNAAHEILNKGDELKSWPRQLSGSHAVPVSYESDIDEAIDMLERTTDEEITLTHSDYKKLVQGQWSWREQFNALNSRYLGVE